MFLEIIKYVAPFIGVILGWVLSQQSEKNKATREDKRKLNKTLYYLLEIRFQLSLHLADEEIIKSYFPLIKRKLQNVENFKDLDDSQFKEVLRHILKGIFSDPDKPLITENEIDSLNNNFKRCIDNLSEVDAILAFRLNGKQNIQPLLNELLNRSKKSVAELTNGVSDVDELHSSFEIFHPKLLKETIRDLEIIMLDIATQINKRTYKMVKARFSVQKPAKEHAEIEGIIDRILLPQINK